MAQSNSSEKTDQWATAAVANSEETFRNQIGRYRVERTLGRGAFGQVYLARDDELKRSVAIKVPHPQRFCGPEDAAAFMEEARAVASLDHPAIVPVYDVGTTEDGSHYVVSKYIDGSTLADVIHDRQPVHRVARLVSVIAEALHHAHKRGLFHRDVKPANVLVDRDGEPFITDFGIALKETDFGKGAEFVGTPAYMSPEQARGEGHRVDGRADIFSLGVVLYEGLTGRKPYSGDSVKELLHRISRDDVRPPRQLVDSIPRELERICLKALARRASERYTTAMDFAEDLQHFLNTRDTDDESSDFSIGPPDTSPGGATETKAEGGSTKEGPLEIGPRVIPKGLRSFDGNDAEFFLPLLPGPRDRDGLPDVLRFWKTRLEDQEVDNGLAVGLIYGPSGCGKTSLIQAGLLPRLDDSLVPVYVEASPHETENDLLRILRRRCPSLSHDLGLVESLTAVRRGDANMPGSKVTLVLDQFEQWLQAHVNEDQPELVAALRQCDGVRLQCVLMVRDDFWMAATRFMRQLEVRLIEGDNCAAVDLFDQRHAQKVLTAFGRAYTALPGYPHDLEKQQIEFVEQAVSELAEAGQVIPVRLTLFAEMVKRHAWLPATLRSLGGASGVGVTFLEETFCSPQAAPEHRRHEKAARAVLQALLPEGAGKIRGARRPASELRERSGYGKLPDEFDRLIHILDSGVRLITPSDPAQADGDQDGSGLSDRAYQLTHDYLVPSVREWLDKNRRRTMRDRAQLRLTDRAEMWNARPESRQLPSLGEWIRIRALVPRRQWSQPQTSVMQAAGRYHLRSILMLCAILLCIGFGAWEWSGQRRARNLQQRLLEADIGELPSLHREIEAYRRWTEPLLREAIAAAERDGNKQTQLRVALALVPRDSSQIVFLREQLLAAPPNQATPSETRAIGDALAPYASRITPLLWEELRDPKSGQLLQAASLLARYDEVNPDWATVAGPIVRRLLESPLSHEWMSGLLPVRDHLFGPLAESFRAAGPRQSKAGELLINNCRDQPAALAGLVRTAPAAHWASLIDALKLEKEAAVEALQAVWQQLDESPDETGPDRARVGVALEQLGVPMLQLGLRRAAHPDRRSYFIEYVPRLGISAELLLERTKETAEPDVLAGLFLCLGSCDPQQLADGQRRQILQALREAYDRAEAVRLRSALEWALRSWGQWDSPQDFQPGEPGQPADGRDWYVTSQGQTMAIVEAPVEFVMGSPEHEANRLDNELLHTRQLPQAFALATTEVTVAQFQHFLAHVNMESTYLPRYAPTLDCPQISVNWYGAAAYCNWLSEQERLPPDQWCYVNDHPLGLLNGWRLAEDHLQRTGYRLPTEAEWEFACRAGTTTSRPSGDVLELMSAYAWHSGNSNGSSHPVATRKPNDFGLFDMLGNVFEWCHEPLHPYRRNGSYSTNGAHTESSNSLYVLRGGSYANVDLGLRSASRTSSLPARVNGSFGFRVARTMPD